MPNNEGKTALDIAVQNSDADVVTLLRLAALNEVIRDENDMTGADDDTSLVAAAEMIFESSFCRAASWVVLSC